MHIHIFTDREIEPRTLRRRLPETCRVTTQKLELRPNWDGKYLDRTWLERHIAANGKGDVVMYVLESWPSSKGNLLGFHYGRTFFDRRVCAVKYRPGWTDTAEHELLHAADALIYTYTGHDVSELFDVDSFSEDVVHGRHPDFTEYDYEDAWLGIGPLLHDSLLHKELQGTMKKLVVRLRQYVLALTRQVEEIYGLQHPVPGFRITQPYGVANSRYPLTRHHIGTDYATPIGTPVLAPWDGEVVSAGYHDVLGNHCVYRYTFRGQQFEARFLHLFENPLSGPRKRGEEIGYTGNTGDSDGAHLHVDVWKNNVRISGISAHNFRDRTVDPEKHYG